MKHVSSPQRRSRALFALFSLLVGAYFFQVSSLRSSAADASSMRAQRLERVSKTLNLSLEDVERVLSERRLLLQRSTDLVVVDTDGNEVDRFRIALSERPSWVAVREGSSGRPASIIDRSIVKQSLKEEVLKRLPEPRHCEVNSVAPDAFGVARADVSCIAKPGYIVDWAAAAASVADALEADAQPSVSVTAHSIAPTLSYGGERLSLVATGRSNFKGSGDGRKFNVRKAINEKLNGVTVAPGEVFSFNGVLGGPVSTRNGWKEALTIFEGTNLRPAPGGGMCQASTTLYRAVLRAGLPILAQKNHSLYVSYYEAHGVGQDATVFPGQQDFRFQNDTSSPIILQAYTDGDDAYVRLYGADDGRRVTLEGPYFMTSVPAAFAAQGKHIRVNEVSWVRTVERGDAVSVDLLTARYKAIPKRLRSEMVSTSEVTRSGPVYASAGERFTREAAAQ